MTVFGAESSAIILATVEHRVLVVVSLAGGLSVIIVMLLVRGFVGLQVGVSLMLMLIAHVFRHVPLLKLLFVLHHIWEVLASAI